MKVHLRALGCRLNQAELDALARQFQALGHEIVDDATQAEQAIVNTCAVTQDASRSSRQLVRDLHRSSPQAAIAVTGCYAQIAPEALRTLAGVSQVVENAAKDELVQALTGQTVEWFDREPLERLNKAGAVGRTRAFLKVQDGCDHACTFCVTTLARGANRSRAVADVVREAQLLHQLGYQEVVLTGVQLGGYGRERGESAGLLQLVQALLQDTDLPRLRLSSLEPWDIPEKFMDLWHNPRLCRHLHLPLQSGCAATLRRMRRRATPASYRALLQTIRATVPAMKITSDVIVGFPGETEAEFAESITFINEQSFADLHVFRYSVRPGTPAAKLREQVPEAAKKTRSAQLLARAETLEACYAAQFIGQVQRVLWEQVAGVTPEGFINVGYTEYYVRVRCIAPEALTDRITAVQLDGWQAGMMRGHLVPEPELPHADAKVL